MILEAIQIGLLLYAGYKYLTRPKPPKPPGAEPFNEDSIPRNQEGKPLPMFWGTVRVRAPILAHFFGFQSGQNPPIEGAFPSHQYAACMLFILGIPPHQCLTTGTAVLMRFWIGDQCLNDIPPGGIEPGFQPLPTGTVGAAAFVNTFIGQADPDPINSTAEIIRGYCEFAMGNIAFGSSEFRTAFIEAGYDQTLLPSYKGMARVALSGSPTTTPAIGRAWWFGKKPSIDPYSFEIATQPYINEGAAPNYYKTAGLNGGINPMGALHDLLTAKWGKIGLPESRLDLTAFSAVAGTLTTEQHGFSLIVYDSVDAKEIIREICAEIDCVLYEDPTTRLITPKLIREDYTVGSLPLFDDAINDNVLAVLRFEAGSWADTYNQVRVTYTDKDKDYTAQTALAQDTANIAAQGRVRTLELNYPGITTAALASKVAARELRGVSTPLKKVRLAVNRDGYQVHPGDVIRWSNAKYGVSEMVLRVGDVDLGMMEDNRIVLECVQDRFAVDYAIFVPPDEYNFPPREPGVPPPVKARLEHEAPRFIQARAKAAGFISDDNVQHLWHLTRPNHLDVSYSGKLSAPSTGSVYVSDTNYRVFPVRAEINTLYSATTGPYDTATGIVVKLLAGGALVAAAVADIQTQGYNLALIGNDATTAELIAFESITDLGGGQIRLNNVWRDILDTARATHAVGTLVEFVSALGWAIDGARVGSHELTLAEIAKTKEVPRASNGVTLDPTVIDERSSTVTERVHRPFPAADYLLNGVRSISELAAEGMAATWKRRNYLTPTIVRSDAATEAVSASMRHRIYARKVINDAAGSQPFAEVNVTPGTEINGTSVNYVPLGAAGHGRMNLACRSVDGSRQSWQDPKISVTARHWRNLLLNPSFEGNPGGDGTTFLANWTTVSGTPAAGSTAAEALGGVGHYLTWSGAVRNSEVTQTVDISGYGPIARMTARLRFYSHVLGTDTLSSIRVYLEVLNGSSTVVATTDTGIVTPSNTLWNRYDLSVAFPATGVKLRVRVTTDSGVEFTGSSAVFDEFRLTLGDCTANLLANASFESALNNWTVGAGAWTHTLATGYIDNYYSRGNGGAATDELYQQVAVTAGHEANSVAVFECAVARDGSDTDDTGEVIIEARDAAGTTVISSATSGTIAPTGGDLVWSRVRVTLELPPDTGNVRVRLRGTRVGDAGASNVAYDDTDLALHKHLAPQGIIDAQISTPVRQPMPASWARWWQDLGVYGPSYGHWNGAEFTSVAPNASPLITNNGAVSVKEFVGGFDGDSHLLTDCYEFEAGDFSTTDVQRYGNFSRNQTWACTVFFRINPRLFNGGTGCGIVGRRGAARGWALDVRTTGVVRASIFGALATVTADSIATVTDGRLHVATIHWDGTTLRLQLDGAQSSASGASCGEFGTTYSDPCSFRIGRARTADTLFAGQIARVALWYGADYTPLSTELLGIFTHGADPTGGKLEPNVGIATAQRATCAVLAGDELRLVRYGFGQYPVAYNAAMETAFGAGKGWGLAMSGGVTNWANSDFTDGAKWGTSGAPTITQGVRDAEGFKNGVRIAGAGSDYFRALALTLSATADVRVTFFARSVTGGNHTIKVELRNTAGTLIGSAATPTVNTGDYQRIDVNFTWDDSTANGEIWIAAGALSSSIDVSGPVVVHQSGAFWPLLLPCASAATTLDNIGYRMLSDLIGDLGNGLSHDGEIVVTGYCEHAPTYASTIATVGKQDTTFHNRRILDTNATADALFAVYDATPSGVISEVLPTDAEWVDSWTVRGRWSRARLLLDSASLTYATLYGALYFQLGEADVTPTYGDNDLVSIFTVAAGTLLDAELGDLRGFAGNKPINALIRRWIISTREEERFP